uniref:Uncharacterized protein n=1 Tax=Aegilops tauschii subsp. strangulata TaxID=200361 RepID=A0A453DXK2_AEGTS
MALSPFQRPSIRNGGVARTPADGVGQRDAILGRGGFRSEQWRQRVQDERQGPVRRHRGWGTAGYCGWGKKGMSEPC